MQGELGARMLLLKKENKLLGNRSHYVYHQTWNEYLNEV